MLLREIVWKYGRWYGQNIKNWIADFHPNVIFLSMADNVFTLRLAVRVARQYQIPLVAYSTENYCFKNYNYITKRPSLFYTLFYTWLKIGYRNAEKVIVQGYFNTPMLRDAFAKAYNYPCDCLYSRSDIDFINHAIIDYDQVTVSYLGNLGLGRHKALIEVAEALGTVIPEARLDVYGKYSNAIVRKAIEACPFIRYKGFVSYTEVVDVIHRSTLLVHVEQNDAFYLKDLKYAFSTKIADSVCSGTPLLIYADGSLAETVFLQENGCAFVVTKAEQLADGIRKALTDDQARQQVVRQALKARQHYFCGASKLIDWIDEPNTYEGFLG